MSSKIKSIREQIAQQVRSDIVMGVLRSDERLREEVLAERFGVSRGPIRDVLLQLTQEGLLISKRNCGVTVAAPPEPHVLKLMKSLRASIETPSLKRVCTHPDDDQLDEMRQLAEAIQAAFDTDNPEAALEHEYELHRLIVLEGSGQDILNVWKPLMLRSRVRSDYVDALSSRVSSYSNLVAALQAGNKSQANECLQSCIG